MAGNGILAVFAAVAVSLEPAGYRGVFTPGETAALVLRASNDTSDPKTVEVLLRTCDYFGREVRAARESVEVGAKTNVERRLEFADLKPVGFFCTVADWSCGAEKGTAEGSFVKVGATGAAPDRLFGISCYAPDDAEMYGRLGVGAKMVLFSWAEIEGKDGKLDFSAKRREIEALKSKGIAVEGHFSFCTANYAPDRFLKPEFRDRKRRMDKDGDPIADPKAYYAEMDGFVRVVVREFRDDIREWSIGGEINLLLRWAAHLRPRYVETTRLAARAVKAVDPDAVVLALGVSGGDGQENPRYPVLRSILPEIADVIDGFSIDQYTRGTHYGKGYQTMNTEESELREMMVFAHELAVTNGLRCLSIGEKGPAFDTSLPILTPFGPEAGDMVARDYIILRTLPYFGSWYYFRPYNWKVTHGGLDWGMWQDRNPRHTASAYAATARLMAHAEFVREILVHKDVRCYIFRKDGRIFATMWYNGGEPLEVRNEAVAKLSLADVEGNPVTLADGVLRIGRSPLYVSGLDADGFGRLFAAAELNVPYVAAAYAVQAKGRSTLAVRNLTGRKLSVRVVEFAAEPAYAWTKGEIALGPDETRRIALDCSPTRTRIVLQGSVGGRVVVESAFAPKPIRRVSGWEELAKEDPVRLDDPERQAEHYVDLRANGNYTGTDDLSAEGRFGYDDEGILMEYRVKDDAHCNDARGSWLAWQGDSVQFAVDARRDGAFDLLEGRKLGLCPDDANVVLADIGGWKVAYSFNAADGEGGRQKGGRLFPFKPEVVRDETLKVTRYRFKMPFKYLDPLKPVKGEAFSFSFIVFDKDSKAQHVAYSINSTGASVGWSDPRYMGAFIFE